MRVKAIIVMLYLVGMASCDIKTSRSGNRKPSYRYYAVVNNAVVTLHISQGMFNVIKKNGIDSVRIQNSKRDPGWRMSQYTVTDFQSREMTVITIPSSDIHESK
jgi:hypothetical protein